MIKYLEKNNFKDVIKKGVYLVDFYADWCGPCKMMGKVLEKLDDEYNILKVDIDKFDDLATEYKIMVVPAFLFFKDGKKEAELFGFYDIKDIKDTYDKLKGK